MARPKKGTVPATATPAPANGPEKTQREMISEAIAAGTNPRSNIDLSNWIKQTYNVSLTPQQIAQAKIGMGKANKNGRKKLRKKRAPATEWSPGPSPPSTDLVALVVETKTLAEKVGGVSKLKQLLDVLA